VPLKKQGVQCGSSYAAAALNGRLEEEGLANMDMGKDIIIHNPHSNHKTSTVRSAPLATNSTGQTLHTRTDLERPDAQTNASLCCWAAVLAMQVRWHPEQTCPSPLHSCNGFLPERAIKTSNLEMSWTSSKLDTKSHGGKSSSSSSISPLEDQCKGAAGGSGGSSMTSGLLAPALAHEAKDLPQCAVACRWRLRGEDAGGAQFSLSTACDDTLRRFCAHFVRACPNCAVFANGASLRGASTTAHTGMAAWRKGRADDGC